MTAASPVSSSAAAGASPPLSRVVVGTDFSADAALALHCAAEIALSHGAKLTLVHALDPAVAALGAPVQALIDDAGAALEQEAASLRRQNVQAQSQMRLARPWWAITEAAREVHADLVVVGSRGRGALARAALGSTADRVVRACPAPVLVIPSGYGESPSAWRLAVVGMDFSEESTRAMSAAIRLLQGTRVQAPEVVLFHTVALTFEFCGPDSPLLLPEHWDKAEGVARQKLEELAAAAQVGRVHIRPATFRGYPSDGILHEAQRGNADLIAVGTHGGGAINRLLLGSVAERVLHHAGRPVLTARQPE